MDFERTFFQKLAGNVPCDGSVGMEQYDCIPPWSVESEACAEGSRVAYWGFRDSDVRMRSSEDLE